MPVSPNLENTLRRALGNNILSRSETQRILGEVRTADDVAHVVQRIQDAYQRPGADKLEVTQFSRADNLNWLLGQLDQVAPLPLDRQRAQGADGRMNWIAALGANIDPAPRPDPVRPDPIQPDPVLPGGGDPAPAGPAAPLAKKSFGGREVSVTGDGGLGLGGRAVALDLAQPPSDDVLEALQGLARPGQLEGVDAGAKAALLEGLLAAVEAALPIDNEAQGKFRQVTGGVAALATLSESSAALSPAQVDRLVALYADLPNPMSQALTLRALEEAPTTPAQAQAIGRLEAPENQALLLDTRDDLVAGQARTPGFARIEGPAIGFALSALAFAKNQAGIDNVYGGMDTYAKLNPGRGWDAEELGHMGQVLETYVDKYPQTAYVFGTFSTEAPKNVAQVTNERLQAEMGPALAGAAPKFDGVPLAADQVGPMRSILEGLADDGAAGHVTAALSEAADLMNPKLRGRWDRADKPQQPLSPAAFALFSRVAARFVEQRGSTETGMIDAAGLKKAVTDEVSAVKKALVPRLTALNGQPPKFGAATLTADGAAYVEKVLGDHLRSEMSVDNLAEAVEVFAAKTGGKLSAEGLAGLKGLVDDYKGNWPGAKTFDFNKLGRMARFAVEGKEIPLSTLNGQKVGLAEFYQAVAKGVAKSFDANRMPYGWMADRWGRRAKESVELLDVIAQRTAEGAGPVAELARRNPGAEITVRVTGAPGAHEQFVFDVKGRGRFVQNSEGELVAYNGQPRPELFTAQIRPDGAFDVNVPPAGSRGGREWPLATTYGVGDSVDVKFLDPDAVKRWEEGEPFDDEHKILHGQITGFDGKGKYTVAYTKPDGERVEKSVRLSEIEDANNPHDFSLHGSEFSDVSIDVPRDAALKDVIDRAKPIIDKHLPRDGSLAELSPAQLAKRQKACVNEIMAFVRDVMKYPAGKDANPDENSAKYHEIIDGLGYFDTAPLGDLIEIGKGVCRHQCILQHLLMQVAGIDSRLASGAANERDGDYRGLHIWLELTLADDTRHLSDQTWNDAAIPLWDGAYDVDKRRVEMFHRTDRYRNQVV